MPTYLRLNTLKMAATTIRARLERRGFSLAPVEATGLVFRVEDLSRPGSLLEYALGLFHPQALSSALGALQRSLLLRAFDLLKANGTLVYSTCTYNPDENESMIQVLLEHRPATVQPIPFELPHSPGLSGWQETAYDPSIRHCWRLYPHQLDTVGFFLARVGRGA